jgi:tRNA threonylcarbamoyladenosine biosynthesis protein TsaE
MDEESWEVETQSAGETEALGRRLARELRAGDIVALRGGLGSGKTCLTRGIAAGLGVRDRVRSPSFLMVHEYRGPVPLYHLDFFRVDGVDDLREQGYDEWLYGRGVAVIEWSERLRPAPSGDRLEVEIEVAGPERRRFRFRGVGPRGLELVGRARAGG